MRKTAVLLYMVCAWCVMASAVTPEEASGVFSGTLRVGETSYEDRELYVFPGTQAGTVTLVMPDCPSANSPSGGIVMANIPFSADGALGDGTRNGVSVSAASSVTAAAAHLQFSVAGQASVSYDGSRRTDRNYAFTNGGFEGEWTNGAPQGWHSFNDATGSLADIAGNTEQFVRSTEKRPGSAGSACALLKSKYILVAKANGNCTNGQINAGSMTATDASGNYNFSDPSNTGYNTPFAGNPDSLVFWAKYIPADKKPSGSSNRARAHAVITTNARYQDPEAEDYSQVKIAEATINYAATTDMGWQRISVPFVYTALAPSSAAFVLVTFTTNQTPGGGTSSQSTADNIYLDDVEMVYNHHLASLSLNGGAVAFSGGSAAVQLPYSETEYGLRAAADGKGARVFAGYHAADRRLYVYVAAHNYAQSRAYSCYTIQMDEPLSSATAYNYRASVCEGETYSDELFQGITQSGLYTDTLVNAQGADSLVTLELTVLPSWLIEEEMYITTADTVWRGIPLRGLVAADEPYIYYDSLLTVAGCDSVYRLLLHVSDLPVTYGAYMAVLCNGSETEYNGTRYTEPFEGDVRLSEPNSMGGDSVVHLTVVPVSGDTVAQTMTIVQGDEYSWEGFSTGGMPVGKHTLTVSYAGSKGCDSTMVLYLTVLPGLPEITENGSVSVSVDGICGLYEGFMQINGEPSYGHRVYVLPGTTDSTVTLALADFRTPAEGCGDFVFANIPVSPHGGLGMEPFERTTGAESEPVQVAMNGGVVAADTARLAFTILRGQKRWLLYFQGKAVRNRNCALVNGGFEGDWRNNEPEGWHSFASATGEMADFVKGNTYQFVPSYELRPGSSGARSVMLSSTFIMGVKANGNCTNGQVHAASFTADNAEGNYNFSDPANTGFNTPMHGRPDSLVFWAKYIPADRNLSNPANRARVRSVVTTADRYQDPELEECAAFRIGCAERNYPAVAGFGWQRLAVPFLYAEEAEGKQPAYILTTFATNKEPGGGSAYQTGTSLRTNVLDTLYIDDAQLVYSKRLSSCRYDGREMQFVRHVASADADYCNGCAELTAETEGVSARSFIAYDTPHRCIHVYVVADDFVQTGSCPVFRIEFNDSDTEGLHPATTEGLESTESRETGFGKILIDGQLFIRRGDCIYNVSGTRVR